MMKESHMSIEGFVLSPCTLESKTITGAAIVAKSSSSKTAAATHGEEGLVGMDLEEEGLLQIKISE